eukprot:scaffold18646_cov184-Skeletonema_marinoi.AAC.2
MMIGYRILNTHLLPLLSTYLAWQGDQWRVFVELIQEIWNTGRIPTQMLWVVIVLIPKPKGSGGYRGIGLLDPLWKKRGCGTAVLEAKLLQLQQLAYLQQTPLFDAIVREWLRQVLREEYLLPAVEIDGIVRLFTALFYADDGYIASTDAGLLQRSVDVVTDLFDRVGLKTNVAKTKVMTCVDARIRVRQSDEVYYNARHGFRSAKEWNRRRVECDKCGLDLSEASLNKHLETQHGVFRSRGARDTHASMGGKFFCPAPACQDATDSFATPWALRRHFRDRHPLDFVNVAGHGNLPKCRLSAMQYAG